MSYIGLNTQYKQNGGSNGSHCCHRQNNNGCHVVPPTLEVTDVNYEIIREREELRIRIAQLEHNHLQELDILKNNIIAQCEQTLEIELREQEVAYENRISLLNQSIDSLTKKSIQYDSVSINQQKESISLQETIKDLNIKLMKSRQTIKELEQKYEKTVNSMNEDFALKLKKDLEEQENLLNNSFEREKNRLLTQIEDHRGKISEFQLRMKQVAAELEKLRSELHSKKILADEWRFKFESLEKSTELEIYQLKREIDNLQRLPIQKNLEHENKELLDKLEKKKQKILKLRNEVRVQTETIIVEKPVEVERIVEIVKYIPVEKIIKEVQPPKQPIVIQECGVNDKSDQLIRDYQREIEDRDRSLERTTIELEEAIFKLRELQQAYDQLREDYSLTVQERENLIVQINSYNQYIQQLEITYGQKNQELMNKVQQLYQQMTQSQKTVGKIVVKIGKDGKPVVEQRS